MPDSLAVSLLSSVAIIEANSIPTASLSHSQKMALKKKKGFDNSIDHFVHFMVLLNWEEKKSKTQP